MPANQFNVDLSLDTVATLNRTQRDGYTSSPYELFTGDKIDFTRDFRCRWGELVIVKKPKGISSDLKVTGEWAMIVRRFMNHSGVLKVYLVASRRFAYRLKFKRATVPEWVIIAMNSIGDRSIGFEEEPEGALGDPGDIEPPRLEHDDEEVEIQEEHAEEDRGYDAPEFDEAIRILEEADALEDAPD